MLKRRRQHSARFKFQVALEALTGLKTISQLAAEHQVHPNQITKWKRRLLEEGAGVFDNKAGGPDGVPERPGGPALRADRTLEDGTGVAEKKSCPLQPMTNA
jgi:transposase-like protein